MNILLSGVGGQGILFVSRVLTELAMRRSWPVLGAETHGMAQRGGSVVSHVRMGRGALAPMIRKGAADLVLGMEENEGLRYLAFLRPEGMLLVNEGAGKLQGPLVQAYLRAHRIAWRGVPATLLAQELRYPVGVNLIMLAAAQQLGWLPFTREEMMAVVGGLSRSDLARPNLESLACGWRAAAAPGQRGDLREGKPAGVIP